MNERPDISVVAPVYGCRDCLIELHRRVAHSLSQAELEWELILVDDRGPDEPWAIIAEIAEQDARVRGVKLARNHGQHLAIWAGLSAAKGKWTAVIDCDLQDDPALIPRLLDQAEESQSDAVVVDRGTWHDTWLRRKLSKMFYRLFEFMIGIRVERNIGNFGIYSRRLTDNLLRYRDKEVFLPIMVALTGFRRTLYTVDRDNRFNGKSAYTLRSLMHLATAVVIRFTDRPLQLSIVLGLCISALSAIVSLVLFILWLIGTFTVPGWTSVILSVWFLSGMILAVLGIHGFYVGRIFSEVQDRPRIIVETTTEEELNKTDLVHLAKTRLE